MEEKKKRGRPKGSKNKKPVFIEDEWLNLNPITALPRQSFIYRADSCGCQQESLILGAGMFCRHKNSMKLVQKYDSAPVT